MAKEYPQVEGVVTKHNDTGLYVNGAWFNFSTLEHKATETAALKALGARKGHRVRITYSQHGSSGRNYIESLEILDTGGPAPAGPAAAAGNGYSHAESPEVRRSIERQTALKAAVEFFAHREKVNGQEVTGRHVVAYAKEFEAYLSRTAEAPVEAAAAGVR